MRWEQLFADLDARFADLADAEMMAELADRQRHAAGAVTVVQRFTGAIGAEIRIRTRAGRIHTGALREVGPDWVLIGTQSAGEMLVALAAITAVTGLTSATGVGLSPVAVRFDLRLVLRGIARDRSPVVIGVAGAPGAAGAAGTEIAGTLDRIGADFVELADHAAWEARRMAAVRSVVLVPIAAIDSVRAMPAG